MVSHCIAAAKPSDFRRRFSPTPQRSPASGSYIRRNPFTCSVLKQPCSAYAVICRTEYTKENAAMGGSPEILAQDMQRIAHGAVGRGYADGSNGEGTTRRHPHPVT